jgi:peroxiredoxin
VIKTALILLTLLQPGLNDKPEVGRSAINFTLKSFDGETVTLNALKGKVVFLDFWASWCSPCREELPFLYILQKTYSRAGFTVVAVNIDNERENALDFLERFNIKLSSLWDKNKKVVSQYDVEAMPTSIIIDRTGTIRYIHNGFETENFQLYKKQIERLLKENRKKPEKSSAVRKG